MVDGHPPYVSRVDSLKNAIGNIHQGDALRAQEIFVSVGSECIHRAGFDIELEPAESLDGVDDEYDVPVAAEPSYPGEIDTVPAGELHPANSDYAGAFVCEFEQFTGVYPAVTFAGHPEGDAAIRKSHPGVDISWKLDVASDYVIPGTPINAVSDRRDRR